jgi:hypothetical protein
VDGKPTKLSDGTFGQRFAYCYCWVESPEDGDGDVTAEEVLGTVFAVDAETGDVEVARELYLGRKM